MTTQPGLGAAHASSRSAILDVIRAAGTISRVDLTQATGFSAPTVSIVVRRLVQEELVLEVGHGRSTGGKRPLLLQLNPRARFAIGVHLDDDGINFVIGDLAGTIVARWRRPRAGSDQPQGVVERIAREIRATLARVDLPIDKVLGVAVVAPGPLSGHAGLTYAPPVMAPWSDFPLAGALEDVIGLSVVLENDATAAALGEYWAGGIDVGTAFAALYMGKGLGAGIVLDGTVLRGASSNAGEVGHICLQLDGPECWCGSRGCVEALAGPGRVVERALERGMDLPGVSVATRFAEIARAAARGDVVAVELLQDSARYLAVATQTVANLLDLELFVLTGPAFALAGSLYLPVMQEHLDATFFARGAHAARVVISSIAPYSAAIGATALVLQSELSPRQTSSRVSVESQPLVAGG